MPESISRKSHHLPHSAYIGQLTVAVTACIENDIPVFITDAVVKHVVDCLKTVVDKNRCQVPVYCFMPEHAHLVLTGLTPTSDLWRTILDFKQRTGFWLSKHAKVCWQKNFYDHVVRQSEDLKKQIYYILNNPVRVDWSRTGMITHTRGQLASI